MHSFSYVRGFPCGGFYTVTSFNEASEDLVFSLSFSCFTVILCCSSVRGEVSEIWVEVQPTLDEAAALSCVQKASGGGGGNSSLVTRQAATGDIYTGGGKLPPWVSGRVSDV